MEESLAADVEALALLSPGGFERALAGPSLAEGRGRTALLKLPESGAELVVRAVLHGGWLGGVRGGALLRPERALAELRTTAALHRAGAPVVRPALAAARRVRGPVWNAVVGTFLEPDAPDALAWLAQNPERPKIVAAATAAGMSLRRFHDLGGRHADLHVKNLLVRESGGELLVVIADLDRARSDDPPGPARRMKELARLYRSLLKRGVLTQIGRAALAHFLGAYVDGDSALGTGLARHWPNERRRVALHALGYSGPTQQP